MQSLSSHLARSVLDAAPDALIIIDRGGTIRFANKQVSALFGYAHDQLIGQPVECLLPGRFRERHPALRTSYTENVRIRPMGAGQNLFAARRDGSEFPVEISLSPIQDGGQMLVAAAIRDVTQRKRIEDEARAARDEATRADLAKSRFLATASHDLRQPLQALALLNGTLRRLAPDATMKEAVLQQEQAITVMSRLLNALLDISKLESGAIKPDPTDFTVSTLFEELRQEFAALATSKGLSLNVAPCEDLAHSDPSLVGQILRNLVANAIKYTRAGWVALRCLHDRPACIRIEVLDTGIGIPAEQLRYIYDEFFQVGVPTNSTREGYGLGLSIVQRLVNLLGVELEVQSEVGKGSSFALTLPAGHTAADIGRPTERARAAPSTHAPARILVVEDDPAVLSATRMLLKSDGYEVTAATTVEEALTQARTDARIDLLVTDYHLGKGETGTDVVAALRSVRDRPLKVILMTGDTSSAIHSLPQDPLLRVVSKPVNADELLSMLRELTQS